MFAPFLIRWLAQHPAWNPTPLLVSGVLGAIIGVSVGWPLGWILWASVLGAVMWADGRTRHVPHPAILGMGILGIGIRLSTAQPWSWVIAPGVILGVGILAYPYLAPVMGAADVRWIGALACALSPQALAWAIAATCVVSMAWILGRRHWHPRSTAGVPFAGVLAGVVALAGVVVLPH